MVMQNFISKKRKDGQAMKKLFLIPLMIVLASALIFSGCAKPAPAPTPSPAPSPTSKAEPIVLKAISFHGEAGIRPWGWFPLINTINALGKGELVVEWLGGPEVVPTREQPEALIKGVVDMLLTPGAYYESLVPEIYLLHLHEPTVYGTHNIEVERRPGSVYDFVREAHAREGMYFLGRADAISIFHVYTKTRVDNLADLSKLTVAATGGPHIRFIDALGATCVTTTPQEQYTALERGMVDAAALKLDQLVNLSLYEVSKYIIDPPYKVTSNCTITINLDTWNKLPKHLQDVLTEAQIFQEYYTEMSDLGAYYRARRTLQEVGMEFIELAPTDVPLYTSLYNDLSWKKLEEVASPEVYQKIKELAAE